MDFISYFGIGKENSNLAHVMAFMGAFIFIVSKLIIGYKLVNSM